VLARRRRVRNAGACQRCVAPCQRRDGSRDAVSTEVDGADGEVVQWQWGDADVTAAPTTTTTATTSAAAATTTAGTTCSNTEGATSCTRTCAAIPRCGGRRPSVRTRVQLALVDVSAAAPTHNAAASGAAALRKFAFAHVDVDELSLLDGQRPIDAAWTSITAFAADDTVEGLATVATDVVAFNIVVVVVVIVVVAAAAAVVTTAIVVAAIIIIVVVVVI
jgi:hypothetical protein